MRPDARSRRVRARGLHDSDRRAGGRRDVRVESTTLVRRRGVGRRQGRARLHLFERLHRRLIERLLAKAIAGHDAMAPRSAPGVAMQRAVRNLGRDGLAATAISAVDAALWDLQGAAARLPLVRLLGELRAARCRSMAAAASPPTAIDELEDQLAGWVERDGCRCVKMKIGTQPDRRSAPRRGWRSARSAMAPPVRRRQRRLRGQTGALRSANVFAAKPDVGWFEEPVSSDDLAGPASSCASVRRPAWRSRPANTAIRPRLLSARMLEARRGRRAAGRRHALRRHHRLSADRRALRRASHRPFRPLRAGAALARRLRSAALAPSRMVSRSRAHRAHAVRRRSQSAQRRDRT